MENGEISGDSADYRQAMDFSIKRDCIAVFNGFVGVSA